MAGIIESQDFSYSQNTSCLLIEASNFAAQLDSNLGVWG
jgi:hypothetical protein